MLTRQADMLDSQIDRLVYELYGFMARDGLKPAGARMRRSRLTEEDTSASLSARIRVVEGKEIINGGD